jgi:hypothetical protein
MTSKQFVQNIFSNAVCKVEPKNINGNGPPLYEIVDSITGKPYDGDICISPKLLWRWTEIKIKQDMLEKLKS